MTKAKLARYGIPIAICLALVTLYSIEFHTLSVIRDRPVPFWLYFRNICMGWVPVILMYPAVVWLAGRIRLTVDNWRSTVPLHGLLAIAFSALRPSLAFLLFKYSGLYPEFGYRDYLDLLMEFPVFFMLLYWAIVGTHRFMDYIRKKRQYELMTSRLKEQLAWARLDALKNQLHPHFLFNTLNTISSLVHEDPDAADWMLSRLGDLLRMSLSRLEVQEVSVKDELEFIDNYLEIQKIRLQDRLLVSTQISPEVLDTLVPTLILQPIVENAVRHGISAQRSGGNLVIRASREDGIAIIEVEDSGPGISDAHVERGTGLRNTKERLKHHYGSNHVFEIGKGEMGGALVTIGVPYSTNRSAIGRFQHGGD
jgi:signal transduction histidine kinase